MEIEDIRRGNGVLEIVGRCLQSARNIVARLCPPEFFTEINSGVALAENAAREVHADYLAALENDIENDVLERGVITRLIVPRGDYGRGDYGAHWSGIGTTKNFRPAYYHPDVVSFLDLQPLDLMPAQIDAAEDYFRPFRERHERKKTNPNGFSYDYTRSLMDFANQYPALKALAEKFEIDHDGSWRRLTPSWTSTVNVEQQNGAIEKVPFWMHVEDWMEAVKNQREAEAAARRQAAPAPSPAPSQSRPNNSGPSR